MHEKYSMKPLLIIQTSTSYDDLPLLCEHYGDEITWFSNACGLSKDRVRPIKVFHDEILPDPKEVQAIIITGSVDMISDNLPWIARTSEWLKLAIKNNTPMLGVCFGHQLIAHTLGGMVGANPNGAEFGTVKINKTVESAQDDLFKELPNPFSAQVFHYESILEMPNEAVILAENEIDPFHAFRYGNKIWGVQFHPEFDKEIMSHAYDVYAGDMEEAGFDVQKLRNSTVDNSTGTRLLQRFTELAYQTE